MPKYKSISEIVTYTPEMAEVILDKFAHAHNRPLRQHHIDSLGLEMKNKKWRLNGETVTFAEDGTLLDGHNRMWACFNSGAPFTTWVIRHIEADTFSTINVGVSRTAADVIYINGQEKHHRPIATAAGLIMRYNAGKIVTNKKIMPRELNEFYDNHPDLGTWVEAASKGYMRPFAAPIGAVTYLAASHRNRHKGVEFVGGLVTGDNLSKGSPVLALRDRLRTGGAKQGGTAQKDNSVARFALCIQAWNAFVEGRSLTRMQKFTGDKFPKIKGAHV